MIKPRVKINLDGLRKFRDRIIRIRNKDTGNDAAIQELDRSWMRRIREFFGKQFKESSVGGGNWPPLAESTIRARLGEVNAIREAHGEKPLKLSKNWKTYKPRGGTKSRSAAAATFPILNVTGVLQDAVSSLDDGTSIIQEAHPLLGYGGLLFAGGGTDGGIATAELAAIHQRGGDRLPAREIITELSDEVIDNLIADMQKTVEQIANETRNN